MFSLGYYKICDNQGSTKLAQNPIFHVQISTFELQYHYIQEKVISTEIEVGYILTNEQVAYILTKAQGRMRFAIGCNHIGAMKISIHNLTYDVANSTIGLLCF
jgi:hypothetical protein